MAGTAKVVNNAVWLPEITRAINALVDSLDAICTKLNADAGVTDVDYANTGYKVNPGDV